ncbi:snare associated Golgi protein-domain-containing protein, partial [Baffinella frigidus]
LFLRQFVEGIIGGSRKFAAIDEAVSRKFAAIDEAVSRKGFQLVLLLRLSPLLPFALSNYLYGMTKVKFGEYIGGTLIGFAPGSLAFVLSGKLGRELLDVSSGAGEGGVSQLHVPWWEPRTPNF